jgi:hypothetical protein
LPAEDELVLSGIAAAWMLAVTTEDIETEDKCP